jgi:hypothetical protein
MKTQWRYRLVVYRRSVFIVDSSVYMADPRLSTDSQPFAGHRQHVPPGKWME